MRRNIILITSLLFLFAALPGAYGQSIIPATLNATGGSAIAGSNEFDWSVGEMTMVSTFETSSLIVTQGVLQPVDTLKTTGIAQIKLLRNIRVFPNPTNNFVNIDYSAETQGVLQYKLIDMTGKILLERTIQAQQGTNTEQISLAGMASASYLLQVTYTGVTGEKEMTSYKIQKLK